MFEKFTDDARRVVVLAQEESRELRHTYIGTEHLLLGLLRAPGTTAAEILVDARLGLGEARRRVEAIIGRGSEDSASAGHIPFTPRAKRILEMSLREAMDLSQQHIDTEHLLLAILREGEGVAAQILTAYDLDLARVRQQVNVRLGQRFADDPTIAAQQEPPQQGGSTGTAAASTSEVAVLERLDRIEAAIAAIIERIDAIDRRLDQAS